MTRRRLDLPIDLQQRVTEIIGNFDGHDNSLTVSELVNQLQAYKVELDLQNQELIESHLTLRKQNEFYQNLFLLLPSPAILLTGHGLISDLNELALEFLGFTRSTIINSTIFNLLTDDSELAIYEVMKDEVDFSKTLYTYTCKIRRADESILTVKLNIIRIPSVDDYGHGFLITLEDRTHTIDREKSYEIYSAIVSNSEASVIAFDSYYKIIEVNNSFLSRFKIIDNPIGRNLLDVLPNDIVQIITKNYDVIFDSSDKLHKKISYYDEKADSSHYIDFKTFPYKTNSASRGTILVLEDIKGSDDSEDELQRANEVFSHGSDALIITDRNKNVIKVNEAFERITGFKEEEVSQTQATFFLDSNGDKSIQQDILKALDEKGVWLGEIWGRKKSGEKFPQRLSISRIPKKGNPIKGYIASFSDISIQKRVQKNVEILAYYDSLTGTINRNLLKDRVETQIEQSFRKENNFVIGFLDLDHFKEINDLHGHDIGDLVLQEAAIRIKNNIRTTDTLSRIGGDEFVILFTNTNSKNIEETARLILADLEKPFLIDSKQLEISGSLGLAEFPIHADTYTGLLQKSDIAMYEAKHQGKNTFRTYDNLMSDALHRGSQLKTVVSSGFAEEDFTIIVEPILSLESDKVQSIHALVDWKSEHIRDRTNDALPIITSMGMAYSYLRNQLHQLADYLMKTNLHALKGFQIAIDIERSQLRSGEVAKACKEVLSSFSIPLNKIRLRLSGDDVFSYDKRVHDQISTLIQSGFSIEVVGNIYNSINLDQLIKLDIAVLGFDLGGLDTSELDSRQLGVFLKIAEGLGVPLIVYSVENVEQLDLVREAGVELAQGKIIKESLDIEISEKNILSNKKGSF